jgi:hypothetical protein
MSFLDNLENSLKSLEGRDTEGMEDRKQRDAHHARAVAAAPWAEKLRTSAFTRDLMSQATRAGYRLRAKVTLTWLGTTLRFALRESRLELRPKPDGVDAVFLQARDEIAVSKIDLTGDPSALLQSWLETVPAPLPEMELPEDLP